MKLYEKCTLCPRRCGVNRLKDERGFCGTTSSLQVAYAGLHNGEEPPVAGDKGSGTVFFSGCTMQCFFCQNYQLSREQVGVPLAPARLAEIFLALQERGAANINLVSGTHFVPGILEALGIAGRQGLTLPVVWNSSGFDTQETLELLFPLVKVFLPDLKTLDRELATRIFRLPRYPELAARGLEWLARKVNTRYSADLLVEGIIMRHLVLPGEVANTRQVLTWFKDKLYGKVILSLMFQYTPALKWGTADVPSAFRKPSCAVEYEEVYAILEELEIEEGFVQELDNGDHSWSPDFTRENPFPSQFSLPVYSQGKFL